MQEDFHYYATYCAAFLAGYPHEDCMDICYSAQFVDLCSRTLLKKVKGPAAAATTQLQLEMMDARTDPAGLQDITRIWASFHFLPADLYADPGRGGKRYKNKYRLICGPNGELAEETVRIAKDRGLQAAGVAMHILADTWAHRYFAGTPSLVINNTNYQFREILPSAGGWTERPVTFRHSPSAPDDLEEGIYTNSLYQGNENSIMNLGHGRAGHLPDYSFVRYRYLPAWGGYAEITKDNPSDYLHAFCQMICALEYLRGDRPAFARDTYSISKVLPWERRIKEILVKRQLDACADWKALGEEMSGRRIEAFDLDRYQQEYADAPKEEKNGTFLGQFFLAAMRQKSMVTNKIFVSGNMLAGFSVDLKGDKVKGMKDFAKLLEEMEGGPFDD